MTDGWRASTIDIAVLVHIVSAVENVICVAPARFRHGFRNLVSSACELKWATAAVQTSACRNASNGRVVGCEAVHQTGNFVCEFPGKVSERSHFLRQRVTGAGM